MGDKIITRLLSPPSQGSNNQKDSVFYLCQGGEENLKREGILVVS